VLASIICAVEVKWLVGSLLHFGWLCMLDHHFYSVKVFLTCAASLH
jgi:hypothetical protein